MTPVDPSPLPDAALRPALKPKPVSHVFAMPHLFENGYVLTEWELSNDDLIRLFKGRERIRLWIRTDDCRVPPLYLEVTDTEHKW